MEVDLHPHLHGDHGLLMVLRLLALCSVVLCFASESVKQALDRRCLQEAPLWIQRIQETRSVQRGADIMLYTPTTENYTNCPAATLQCFAAETNVLIQEWEISNVRFSLSLALYRTAQKLGQTDSDCLYCELLQEEDAQTFLERLLNVVQLMNTQFCRKNRTEDSGEPGGRTRRTRQRSGVRRPDGTRRIPFPQKLLK